MPYLAVDIDAIDEFGRAAMLAGVDEGHIAIGLMRLWKFCWKKKVAYVTKEVVATFFRGDLERITHALQVCEFIDLPSSRPDIHVRGAEKRLGVLKSRSEGGKKAKGNLKQFSAPEPESVTGSPPAHHRLEPEASRSCSPGLTSNHPIIHTSNHPNTQSDGFLRERLEAIFLKSKGTKPRWTATNLGALRPLAAIPDEEIERRFAIALETPFPRCSTLEALVKHWDDYAAPPPIQTRKGVAVAGTDAEFTRKTEHLENDEFGDLAL